MCLQSVTWENVGKCHYTEPSILLENNSKNTSLNPIQHHNIAVVTALTVGAWKVLIPVYIQYPKLLQREPKIDLMNTFRELFLFYI